MLQAEHTSSLFSNSNTKSNLLSNSTLKTRPPEGVLPTGRGRSIQDVYALAYRREDLGWRNLIFIPFNFGWRMLMAINSGIYFTMAIFEDLFMKDTYVRMNMTTCDNLLTIITIFHAVDFIASAVHRIWAQVQRSMPYQPKRLVWLIIDFISLLPIHTFMTVPFLLKDGTVQWIGIIGLNRCLRCYRIFVELFRLQQNMWLNPLLVCIIQLNALLLSGVSILGSIWYTIGFVNQGKPASWLDNTFNAGIEIDQDSPWDMYIFSLVHVLILLNNELVADVRAFNTYETFFMIMCSYVGMVSRYTFTISSMIQSYLKYRGHMYKIRDHITINENCLMGKKQKIISQYYITFWNNWMGLHKCPVIDSFPLCLQKDVLTDVYWDAIDHSHVLRNFPINIKRHMSLVMKSQFLQPGDYIFRKNQIRSCYYYIASGVVQIMSHYDGVSPIMTISTGSCLGDRSLTLPSPCPTDVICASVCEVRYLTFKNYYTVLLDFMHGSNISQKDEREHMRHTKRMYTLSKAYSKENKIMAMYGVPQDDKLKWIKERWRAINNLDMLILSSDNIGKIQKKTIKPDMTHTSKYLDTIVLNSKVKWDADRCCLRTSCPYTLEPNCNFINAWLSFIVVVVTIDCIFVPYCAAFLNYTPAFLSTWDHMIFYCYITDVYLQVITAVKLVDKTISAPVPLLRYHATNPMFLADLVATLPLREISRLFVPEEEISRYLALPRLLKIIRVYTFFKIKCNNITSSHTVTHVIKYLYAIAFLSYIAACVFFMTVCEFVDEEVKCTENSWYPLMVNDMLYDRLPTAADIMDNITMSLYRIIKFVTTSGLAATPLQVYHNIVYVAFLIFISSNVINFVYSELAAMFIMKRQRQISCENLLRSLQNVLGHKNIHDGLRTMVNSYINLQWNVNFAIDLNIDTDVDTEIISPILEAERLQMISEAYESIPFFKELDSKMFKKIVKASKIYTVPKKFIFCRSGQSPMGLNVVLKGECNATSMLKEDMIRFPAGKTIGPGSCFPLFESVQNICSLQTTVSLTICEVVTIDSNTFRDLLCQSGELLSNIENARNFTESDLDVIESKNKYRKNLVKTANFLPRLNNVYRGDMKQHESLLTKLVRCITERNIIHPHGQFMFIWETLKTIQVIVTLLYIPAMFSWICGYATIKVTIALLLDVFSTADIYVRLRLGHYNAHGVIVHSYYYYITHSFFIDLISSTPVYLTIHRYPKKFVFMLTCLTKMLQIYRVSGYMNAMKSRFAMNNFKMLFLVFTTHVIIIVYSLAHFLYTATCDGVCQDDGTFAISCDSETWLYHSIYYEKNNNPMNLVFYCGCFIFYIILGNDQGGFFARTVKEMILISVMVMIAWLTKCYYIPKSVSYLVGADQNFTKHRDNHRLFWNFINNEGGNKDIAHKIYNYFVFNFVTTKGLKMQNLVTSLHPSLQLDLCLAMYYKGMKCLHLFTGMDKTFIKLLAGRLDETHYIRDTPVILMNQVNDKIYFICEGYVNIYDADREKIKTLGPGSMFGAVTEKTVQRHSLEFTSKYHVSLLHIQTAEFLNLLHKCNGAYLNRFLKLTNGVEYVEYIDHFEPNIYEEETDTTTHSPGILHESSKTYNWCMYFLSMVIPYLTVFPVLYFIAMPKRTPDWDVPNTIYILDGISLMRIFFGFNATRTDEMTGVYISNMKHIRWVYIKSPSKFLLDFVSVFPIEVIAYFATSRCINFLTVNRLLRILIMFHYITVYKDRTYIKIWLRWSEFIIYITLPPYILTCLWLYVTCGLSCQERFDSEEVRLTDPQAMLITSFVEVVTIITFSNSYESEIPWDFTECIMIVLYNIIVFILFPVIMGKYIQTSMMSVYNKRTYEYNIYCMKIYLQLRDLSESLLETLWNYSLLLYKYEGGHCVPPFIQEAPYIMRAQFFNDLYGGHIKYNILFMECNNDLIFQLAGLMKRTIYFPGDFIIRKLDVDGQMYFINSGEVDELDFGDMNEEIVKNFYITGQCFGLAQGLYERIPHMSNYKARTMVEMLTLRRSDWNYLANSFPEDYKTIISTARKISLLESVVN